MELEPEKMCSESNESVKEFIQNKWASITKTSRCIIEDKKNELSGHMPLNPFFLTSMSECVNLELVEYLQFLYFLWGRAEAGAYIMVLCLKLMQTFNWSINFDNFMQQLHWEKTRNENVCVLASLWTLAPELQRGTLGNNFLLKKVFRLASWTYDITFSAC